MKSTAVPLPLEGKLVVELGRRTGASACAGLLAQLGATVVVAEPERPSPDAGSLSDKWNWRNAMLAGKLSWPAEDLDMVRRLCEVADVVVVSSDLEPAPAWARPGAQVVCDVTAWGSGVGREGSDEWQMQALTGILATTGPADGAPLPIPVPLVETLAGLHAAGAVLAALRHAGRSGRGQDIDIALYDCGFAAMSSFFSRLLSGSGGEGKVRRMGNQHTLSAPWNVYRARDGWILICTGSNEQWQRLCTLMGRPDAAQAPTLLTSEDRVSHVAEVDAMVQSWIGGQSVADCCEAFARASIPGGPVVPIDGFPREANLLHRGMVLPLDGAEGRATGSPLAMSRTPGRALTRVPVRGGDPARVEALACRTVPPTNAAPVYAAALAGIRVVEIGHYTTAPVAGRHLAALGADVVKVEPPGGEAARGWAPMLQGQSVFYTVSNSDKRDVVLDLASAEGRARLRSMLSGADVLLENLKPGTLAKHGFSTSELEAINPRLVSCAISGFGAESIYAARPAFDTVVQGMSGLMDRIRHAGVPYKTGISTADVMGAAMAVVGVLGALLERDRSGRGQCIDLSMQDLVAWATHPTWARPPQGVPALVSCRDGLVLARGHAAPREAQGLDRSAVVARMAEAGARAAPVLTPAEVLHAPETRARGLHLRVHDERGEWPALAVPLRLLGTPPVVRRPGPRLGAHDHEFGLDQAWLEKQAA